MEEKSYRNVNNSIVVPGLKCGLNDMIVIFGGELLWFFVCMILMNFWLFAGAILLTLGTIIAFIVYMIVRKNYLKEGRVDMLWEIIDYYFEDYYFKGREEA